MSSGMAESQPSPGESPLDQERDRGPKDRERTPDAPGEKPQPEPGGEEEKGEKPSDKDTKDPNGKFDNPPEGKNRRGSPREQRGDDATPGSNDADGWGELPIRFRETFRNQGRDDLPVQYRDWIDSYYRRLNETR
ncbi:MAG: hypothetical protein MJA83_04070 [Gammaproteobacteria bacterium]|nr:hypothetical protein [Gammaproteobacteria bacterium]